MLYTCAGSSSSTVVNCTYSQCLLLMFYITRLSIDYENLQTNIKLQSLSKTSKSEHVQSCEQKDKRVNIKTYNYINKR